MVIKNVVNVFVNEPTGFVTTHWWKFGVLTLYVYFLFTSITEYQTDQNIYYIILWSALLFAHIGSSFKLTKWLRVGGKLFAIILLILSLYMQW